MYEIKSTAIQAEDIFVVHIPFSFQGGQTNVTTYLKIIFNAENDQWSIVKPNIECFGSNSTVYYGKFDDKVMPLELGYYIDKGIGYKFNLPDYIRFHSMELYSGLPGECRFIPLPKLIQYAQDLYKIYKQVNWTAVFSSEWNVYMEFASNLRKIEQHGLAVNPTLYEALYNQIPDSNNLVYSKYNLFTSTGRPSNANNGVNFAAIPKEGDKRLPFISRFKNGTLVEVDFKSYHVHLIAQLINYEFPIEDIHTYFGQWYFGVTKLSEQQYELSKARTFKALYSNNKPDHPFFIKVKDLAQVLYEEYKTNGYVMTPIFNRKLKDIEGASESKVLNYFIQCYETERNSQVIQQFLALTNNMDSKFILYTYDAFLFDVASHELDTFTSNIVQLLQKDKYPFTLKFGQSYQTII